MRALKIIGGGILAIVIILLALGSLLPSEYRVERSAEIAAPPEAVFAHVNSLKRWDAWSPWIARDKSIDNSFSGPDEGAGARVTWTSDGEGSGSQEITRSVPHTRIETHLDFGDQGSADADWTFEATSSGTRVTWGMHGDMPGPLGGLIASQMERFIGPDYEDGLTRLAKHVEAQPPPPPQQPEAAAGADAGPPADAGTAPAS